MDVPSKFQLAYTKNDWEILEAMALREGANTFREYITNRLRKLKRTLPEDITAPVKRSNNYLLPTEACAMIYQISQFHNISVAYVVRWYVSDPLIKDYYKLKESAELLS